MTVEVLAVAGEPSGDRILAGVASALAGRDIAIFGLGGSASRARGVELVADLATWTGMGSTEVISRLPAIGWAVARLLLAARRRRPRAAILVDYTEVNLRLGRLLRAQRIPVLWCVAPQVWAWRPKRAPGVARSLDKLAVVLPFEEALWRSHGVDATYVGHPALDVKPIARVDARRALDIALDAPAIALLPGSRPHELRAHLPTMLTAFERFRTRHRRVEGRLLLMPTAGQLPTVLHEATHNAGVTIVPVDPVHGAIPWLGAFDAAVVTSGTATLECALAGASPVVVYRASRLTAAIARRTVITSWIGLPNVILGRKQYPELLQEHFEPTRVADALADTLESPTPTPDPRTELREKLELHTPTPSTTRMAEMLAPWLDA